MDKKYPGHHLRAARTRISICTQQTVSWPGGTASARIKLLPGQDLRPALRLQGAHGKAARRNRAWRLVGTVAEGTFCHKPCTVSGGGKSEISKPITDAILTGPVFVADFKKDFDQRGRID